MASNINPNERVLQPNSLPDSDLELASVASGLGPEYLSSYLDADDIEMHEHEHSYGGSQTPTNRSDNPDHD